MAPEASATDTARHAAGWPRQVLRRGMAHWSPLLIVTLALLVALGPLTSLGQLRAIYGLAGLWIYPVFSLPAAWAMGVMAYTLLRPRSVAGSGREAVISRWLRWSTLLALACQQAPWLYYDHWLDVLQLSGWLMLLIGLELAGRAPARLRLTLTRLSARGVLSPAERVEEIKQDLERVGHGWTVASAVCVAVALLVTSPLALLAASESGSWALGPVASSLALLIVAGAVAGSWLGRMTGYGLTLSRALRRRELHLRLIPGHPDGAAGLKPVGDFHLYQSLAASLPAIFLGAWVLALSLAGGSRLLRGYQPYLGQYLWLLPLAMLFEILVFVLPMRSVHTIMKSRKEHTYLPVVDKLSAGIAAAEASLDDPATTDQDAIRQRMALLTEHYQELESIPTWPVSRSILRRFTLRNVGLLIPFVGYIIGNLPFWQQISDVLKG
jgi:hypothetical protein